MNKIIFSPIDLGKNSVLTTSEFLNRNKNLIQDEIDKKTKEINIIINNNAWYEFEENFSNKYWIRKSRWEESEIHIRWWKKKIMWKLEHKKMPEKFKEYISNLFWNNDTIYLITKPDFIIYLWKWEKRKKIIIETKSSTKSIKKKQNNTLILEKLLNPGWYEAIVYIIKNNDWIFIDENWVIRIWYNFLIENNIDTVEKLVEKIQELNNTYDWKTEIHYYKK